MIFANYVSIETQLFTSYSITREPDTNPISDQLLYKLYIISHYEVDHVESVIISARNKDIIHTEQDTQSTAQRWGYFIRLIYLNLSHLYFLN